MYLAEPARHSASGPNLRVVAIPAQGVHVATTRPESPKHRWVLTFIVIRGVGGIPSDDDAITLLSVLLTGFEVKMLDDTEVNLCLGAHDFS